MKQLLNGWVLLGFLVGYTGAAAPTSVSSSTLAPTFSIPKFKLGRFRFALKGDPFQNYRIEGSADQTNWVEVMTTNSPGGEFVYVDHVPPYSSQRLYRALPVGSGAPLDSPKLDDVPPLATTNRSITSSASAVSQALTLSTLAQRFANTWPIAIPSLGAAPPYPSIITVSGIEGTVSKLTVSLEDVSHSHPDDIDVLLVGPGGQRVILMSNAGGGAPVTHVTFVFDETVGLTLPDENQLVSGTFKPTNFGKVDIFMPPAPTAPYEGKLSDFNGSVPNGNWALYVMDDEDRDEGIISGGWSVTLDTMGPGTAANTPPVINDIPDRTIYANQPSESIPFTVGDVETPAGSLIFSGSSSNPELVPSGNIVFEGSGTNRTLAIVPADGQIGATTVTVTVTDGAGASASDTFALTVIGRIGQATFLNRGNISIPEFGPATPYPSSINVSGMSGLISAIKVTLNSLSHTWPEDISVFLANPTGRKIVLMSSSGSGYQLNNTTLVFDSTSLVSLPDEDQIVSGTYRPTSFKVDALQETSDSTDAAPGKLSDFNGASPNGIWSLYVEDDEHQDSGSIADGWSLTVTTTNTPPQITDIVLPIEVFGEDGSIESATVNLPASVTTLDSISLWLQVHGLGYADKASIQVNNSSWVSLNNTNPAVSVANPGKGYGGIGGGFGTLKLTISLPAGTVVAGANTVRFGFNFTDGKSVGFRVLKFNFLSSTGQPLLDASAFRDDDPNSWLPPRNTQADIDQGKTLWYTGQLQAPLKSPLLPGGSVVQAHCTDCHAQDGRDLKYFNYSNRSIIERAKFHGLSTAQGEQIASYIRSLNMINPGRPWNPPYQPGPGLDAKPVAYWAAGAGVDWVLDRDEDALPFIFPGGVITSSAMLPSQNLSAREVPIVMQLPDWNHWLPPIHPKDAWGVDAFISTGNKLLSAYNGDVGVPLDSLSIARSVLKKGDATSLRQANFILGSWVLERFSLMRKIGPAPWTGDEVSSQKVYGTGLWQLTKMWEMMQEFEMEGLAGPTLFGARAEPRTWPPSRLIFDVSPNIEQLPSKHHGINDNREQTHRYFSMAWYHLQLLINNGNRSPNTGQSTQFPIDWGYIYAFLKDVRNDSGVPNAMQYWLWAVKSMQVIENGLGPERYNTGGWDPYHITDPSHMTFYDWNGMWASIPASTRKALIEAYLRNWMDKNELFSPSQYYTGDNGGITTPAYIPVHNGQNFGDNIVTMFVGGPGDGYSLSAYQIDDTLQNEILDWATTIWPLRNWESLRPR